jgi:hypothetical protein
LGVVARVFRLLALLSAFFVVAVRCVGGFPVVMVCVPAVALSSEQAPSSVCPPSDQPASEDTLAPVDVADGEDDGAEALLTPSALELALPPFAEPSAAARGALAAQRPLPSHAPSLERPPRA